MKKDLAVIVLMIVLGSFAAAMQIEDDQYTGLKIVEWSPQLLAES